MGAWMTNVGIDADLWQSYQIGVVIGILLVTTLTLLFHGEMPSEKIIYDDDTSLETTSAKTRPPSASTTRVPSPACPPKFRQTAEHSSWSPHGQMNFVVYLFLIGVTLYLLSLEYKGSVAYGFAYFFPKEAALLGI